MPSVRDNFFAMLAKGAEMGSAGALQGIKGRQQAEEGEADRKLKELLQGKQQQFETDKLARQKAQADEMYRRNPKAAVRAGDYSYNPEASQPLKMQLTPAQQSAETAAGKKITDFVAAGGRPAMEKDLAALQQAEQEVTKRDAWDRNVGGALNSWPTLQGLLAPKEKALRDKVRNTALAVAKKTDGSPTQATIDQVLGGVYDSPSDNQSNKERISKFLEEKRKEAADMERAVGNYNATGYATMGVPQTPSAPAETPRQKLERLRKTAGKR